MMRYVIALFLINTYSGSLGAPTSKINEVWTNNTLLPLSKNCGILSKQIENTNCSISTQAALGKKQLLECLMFYDINNQLCSAINNSALVITEDITTKVKQEQDAENLCNTAKDWTFSKNIRLFANLTTIFNNTELCKKFCGVEDLLSTDSIYICKYYYWGWDKLKNYSNPSNSTVAAENVDSSPSVILPAVKNTERNTFEMDGYDTTRHGDPSLKNNTDKLHSGPETSTIKYVIEHNQRSSRPGTSDKLTSEQERQLDDHERPIPSQSLIPSDYDEEDDHNQGDDDGEVVPPNADNRIDIHNSGVDSVPQKAFIIETPEDDHFFPFFLTAIILVVLLYVLYHNKGKVTKVVLGLIVEGRQTGRRRNSRGHAYRRLDTLEQAMSGNLAAQPSKIIY